MRVRRWSSSLASGWLPQEPLGIAGDFSEHFVPDAKGIRDVLRGLFRRGIAFVLVGPLPIASWRLVVGIGPACEQAVLRHSPLPVGLLYRAANRILVAKIAGPGHILGHFAKT